MHNGAAKNTNMLHKLNTFGLVGAYIGTQKAESHKAANMQQLAQ